MVKKNQKCEPRTQHALSGEEIERRTLKLMDDEQADPERWIYLSFATDEGFRGAVVIKAHGLVSAARKAHELGINPGGQVAMWDVPEPPEWAVNRLLTKEEVARAFGNGKTLRELEEESGWEVRATGSDTNGGGFNNGN